MKNHFKILIFSIICTALPFSGNAETAWRPTNLIPVQREENTAVKAQRNVHEKRHRVKLASLFFHRWKNGNPTRAGLIGSIVLLSILAILMGGLGLVCLSLIADAGGLAGIAIIFTALGLGIAVMCLSGIVKVAKQLKGQDVQGRQEELPHRPPSKNLKKD